jgi:glutathione peroxidase
MSGFFDQPVTAIDGTPDLLSALRGHVVLAVNVASRCGYTPQYAGLERLQQELAAERFTVVGFPCNQFGAQEPGTEQQILEFCTTKFAVSFRCLRRSKSTVRAGIRSMPGSLRPPTAMPVTSNGTSRSS